MLRWLWARRTPPLEPNRKTRRALARISRPQRSQMREVARLVKSLPQEKQDAVLARLSDWEADLVRRWL